MRTSFSSPAPLKKSRSRRATSAPRDPRSPRRSALYDAVGAAMGKGVSASNQPYASLTSPHNYSPRDIETGGTAKMRSSFFKKLSFGGTTSATATTGSNISSQGGDPKNFTWRDADGRSGREEGRASSTRTTPVKAAATHWQAGVSSFGMSNCATVRGQQEQKFASTRFPVPSTFLQEQDFKLGASTVIHPIFSDSETSKNKTTSSGDLFAKKKANGGVPKSFSFVSGCAKPSAESVPGMTNRSLFDGSVPKLDALQQALLDMRKQQTVAEGATGGFHIGRSLLHTSAADMAFHRRKAGVGRVRHLPNKNIHPLTTKSMRNLKSKNMLLQGKCSKQKGTIDYLFNRQLLLENNIKKKSETIDAMRKEAESLKEENRRLKANNSGQDEVNVAEQELRKLHLAEKREDVPEIADIEHCLEPTTPPRARESHRVIPTPVVTRSAKKKAAAVGETPNRTTSQSTKKLGMAKTPNNEENQDPRAPMMTRSASKKAMLSPTRQSNRLAQQKQA